MVAALDFERAPSSSVIAVTENLPTGATERATLAIGEVAERTGLSGHTLRYYERAGLITSVPRSSGGMRRYSAADLDWIAFLLRLRDTGLPISEMQRFAELRRQGPSTTPERLDLLRAHRRAIEQQIRSLRTNAEALDDKINYYAELSASSGNAKEQS